ncbi:5-methyltetrahydropteroyltriglutamate--homocysteine S-methyltransferase [Desulfovibrio desulfuricans]|uniref:5-methyltetrahydropteroyltriglutamate-- homocysteine S-methyltransferase n=1 Tax=Desulfovibrio desulfuricans TaxID=876 RepID=UPI001781223F|nr:5-methyltetrahydropteroyltriglutamate--homocysteine S-methyltransferase [Desulfovibrio desulfuricans]MBD8894701.1 5-methyltetrahydropteroyltriglutamate--homocysteine S-methyltransferase [Desulfovibrio desulfuricans]
MKTHILGFPSIGRQRELKQALESFWNGSRSAQSLIEVAANLKKRHWRIQRDAGLAYVTTGDFSLYDRMLDITCMLGTVPARFAAGKGDSPLERYFSLARGDALRNLAPMEMTKWFDTNYHYLVPEIEGDTPWQPGEHPVLADTALARDLGFAPKPALIGPFTWLTLAKSRHEAHKWSRLESIALVYADLLASLAPLCDSIQIEEPVLSTELLPPAAVRRFTEIYAGLNAASGNRLMLTAYFGPLEKNLALALDSGCAALHVDMVRGRDELGKILAAIPDNMALSLGAVNGRNIWKTDFARILPCIAQATAALGSERVLVGSSCSLLHSPVDLEAETALPEHIRHRMAFAVQKCAEVANLGEIMEQATSEGLQSNTADPHDAAAHPDQYIETVRQQVAAVIPSQLHRKSSYPSRKKAQGWLALPPLPTTTIGSFPQTAEIRKIRRGFKNGSINEAAYTAAMQNEIRRCIEKQEQLGLDVLVHGEAERNDMVEYFGQQLGGFCFTQNGWVQSYGSRCVKPPVIYGDVFRKQPMTIAWIRYAQSLTQKPVKGMLTGPATILCWSFVRDDLPRAEVCKQIALAIRDEVLDLEKAGVRIIQIDEAALREGMPLTRAAAEDYLHWAVEAFRLATSGVADSTQIHTHMCYSEFNAILPWIAQMDADVISIESSRSGMELLEAFDRFNYANEVGPGVYDIHSPRVPSTEEIVELLRRALRHIPAEKLWVNPDCGLKTRQWDEAYPSLKNMVEAAKTVRAALA